MSIASLFSAVLLGLIFPRVENPWPQSIGLGFPFAMAGVGGVLASVFLTDTSDTQRDRAIRLGGLWGFRLGALLYALSLVVQVAFKR